MLLAVVGIGTDPNSVGFLYSLLRDNYPGNLLENRSLLKRGQPVSSATLAELSEFFTPVLSLDERRCSPRALISLMMRMALTA